MDVRDVLTLPSIKSGDHIKVSGWLVDTNDGLFVLGDHYPEDYNYPHRLKISNGNIIYEILAKIPSLVGGWSCLFYRTKIDGILESQSPCVIKVESILIEAERESGNYERIDINEDDIAAYVKARGDYRFNRPRDPMRDWLLD